jgi:hypothetical protein
MTLSQEAVENLVDVVLHPTGGWYVRKDIDEFYDRKGFGLFLFPYLQTPLCNYETITVIKKAT